ncbi:poly [ADP-ribose] polymerase 1-like [Brevipalpus obovatus]|uniref:poly [ADP-ribose] polymerase 1-like n=1 Tax=Brevipalpus obovatus TaxID=246614 RepID=UPI003D9E7DED
MVDIYSKIRTDIRPLERNQPEYEIIEKYFMGTTCKNSPVIETFNPYKILNIFKVDRLAERENYSIFKSMTNRKLLCHGTEHTNIVEILTHGLKIRNQRICFTDRINYAAYACQTYDSPPIWGKIRFIFLCEVALGRIDRWFGKVSNFICDVPLPEKKSYDSTHCVGRSKPSEWKRMNLTRFERGDTFPDGDLNDCDYEIPW